MEKTPRPKIRVRIKPRTPPTDAISFHVAVEDTLRQKVKEAVLANLSGGLLICAGAVVAAIITYWVAFALLGFLTQWVFTMPFWLKRLLSWGIVIGLYVLHARTNVEELMELEVESRHGGSPFTIAWPAVGLLNNVEIFSPKTIGSFLRLVAAIWLTSPQLMWAGIADVKRAMRLRQMDIPACATIIGMMLGKNKMVSFEEILAAYPHLDVGRVVGQLLELDGVVLLREEPVGLTLTPDLRHDFLAGCGLSA